MTASVLHLVQHTDEGILVELFKEWRTWMYARGLAVRTVEDRLEVMARVPDALHLTPRGIDQFIAQPHLSAGSRKHYHSVLRAWSDWLVRSGRRPDDPTRLAPPPKIVKSQPRPLQDAHLDALLATPMRRRTRAMILLGLQAGLRVSEISSITTSRFDLVGGVLIIKGKGSKERDIPIHSDLLDLVKIMPPKGPWFRSPVGNAIGGAGRTPILPRSVSATVGKTMRRAGLPKRLTAHSLRHTFATRLIREGVGVEKVQKLMGHESMATTEVYVGIDMPQLKDAIAALPAVSKQWTEIDTAFPFED